MKFSRTGIILNSEKYMECVDFYGKILGLNILFERDRQDEKLTCFDLGGVYLMVETGGRASPNVKPIERCPTKFRFNVSDVDAASDDLRRKGVTVEVRRHEWGTTAEFADPDGNRCALRSDAGFDD
ncbi:VOC family protein [Roseovarius sp. M141]|uniref:VOC family protein n=1 Tax=Roseovarius sp. M141 TaxID=2583806 RepID=UPI0020CD2072|nr:VOC family protein [Roseovarius sp. M141]MCQ0090241.1 glyoxalase [Roseovarius sp. M141]